MSSRVQRAWLLFSFFSLEMSWVFFDIIASNSGFLWAAKTGTTKVVILVRSVNALSVNNAEHPKSVDSARHAAGWNLLAAFLAED